MQMAQVKRAIRVTLSQRKRLTRVNERTSRRLHLGCGEVAVPGFCNVDADPSTRADVVDDIMTLGKFPAGFAEQIYACHVLEHVSHADAPKVLSRWHAVLAPGGELRISVPDIDRIVRVYVDNWEHFQTDGNSPWVGLIYGGQEDRYDFHKTGFNLTWMRHLLERAGFRDVEEYPHEPHWLGVRDASLAHEPFGQFISLNVRAIKPRDPAPSPRVD
jgi:predicted SAM-dependent methyltransferase